jgi:hypothetical protein
MNTNNTPGETSAITAAERLLDEILALPDDMGDDCIDPYEAIQYAKGELDLDRGRAVKRHRESCDTCAKFLDGIFDGLDEYDKKRRLLPWLTDQFRQLGVPLLEQVSERLRPTAFGRSAVRRTIRLPLALPEQFRPVFEAQVFDTGAFFEASTPDQRLRWKIVDEGADVVVTFDSEVEDLVEMPAIRLLFGEAVEDVAFARCAGRVVGTAVFSKTRIGHVSAADVIQLEVDAFEEYSSE